MLSAGAACVGVGTAIVMRGENAFALILEELKEWLATRGYGSLDDIRGRTRRIRESGHAPTNPPPVPGGEKTRA